MGPLLVVNGVITPTWNGGYNSSYPSIFGHFIGALFDSRWQGLRVEADDVGYSCAIASCRDSWEMAMAPRVAKRLEPGGETSTVFLDFHPGFVGKWEMIQFEERAYFSNGLVKNHQL